MCNPHGVSEDYNECLRIQEEAGVCVKNALQQENICENCHRYHFDRYAAPSYVQEHKNYQCERGRCDPREYTNCMQSSLNNLATFHDTSVVDDMISCFGQWNPEGGRANCVKVLNGYNIEGYADPIEAYKEFITEVKNGCDPVVAFAECRMELKILASLTLPHAVADQPLPSMTVIKSTIDAFFTCVQTELKNYPCKKVSTILAGAQDSLISTFIEHVTKSRPVPGKPASPYETYCQGENTKFARFAQFVNLK
eukprot:GHVU01166411.1.p1 GENE.GHVU01166411.1~~GHVU01166411.1.p1  ORF type:complete len:273 (-),score=13.99 GHVU01166411.1:2335-3093(-)